MKLSATLLLFGLLAAAPKPPDPTFFRYQRPLNLLPGTPPNACAILDAQVYQNAAATLDDLRLYASGQELPYAITLSRTSPTGDPARILNLGLKSPRQLSFDLQMPPRPYSSVELSLAARDFLASARVTGLASLEDKNPTLLGTFSLFDLTAQRLGRSSTLALAESTFPYLHLELTLTPAPGASLDVTPALVTSAEIPPSRQAQTLYTPVAETPVITQRPRESVASFTIPAHIPIERITVELDPADPTNFSRPVTISAKALSAEKNHDTTLPTEKLSGEISRVRLTESGQEIHQESLSIPAILGSNTQSSASIEVAIQNGDDRPLKVRAIRLEMRQRKLCFTVPNAPATLFYGGSTVPAPVYDFDRLFNPSAPVRPATLAAEQPNPLYTPHLEKKSLTERYPQILWAALLATISLLAVLAFRSARRIG